MTSLDFIKYAENAGVYIEYGNLNKNGSCALFFGNDFYVVGLDDREMNEAERKSHLAHEIGHCETGAFYDLYSPIDNRAWDEHRANVWAIKKLLPKEELQQAFEQGFVEMWQLAEHFEVTEELVRFACEYYFERS